MATINFEMIADRTEPFADPYTWKVTLRATLSPGVHAVIDSVLIENAYSETEAMEMALFELFEPEDLSFG